MTENTKSMIGWISVALILFGMAASAIAFTVTTNNKADNNKESIASQEQKNNNQDERIRYLELQTKDVSEMKKDIKEGNATNTQILVAIQRLETKIEEMEKNENQTKR